MLSGDIPSKKNSYRANLNPGIITFIRKNLASLNIRALSKFARVRPDKKYTEWETRVSKELVAQTKGIMYLGRVEIWFRIYFPRKGQAGGDTDNKVTSILDALQKAGILSNDSYDCVETFHVTGIYRKGKGGAEFIIEDKTQD